MGVESLQESLLSVSLPQGAGCCWNWSVRELEFAKGTNIWPANDKNFESSCAPASPGCICVGLGLLFCYMCGYVFLLILTLKVKELGGCCWTASLCQLSFKPVGTFWRVPWAQTWLVTYLWPHCGESETLQILWLSWLNITLAILVQEERIRSPWCFGSSSYG